MGFTVREGGYSSFPKMKGSKGEKGEKPMKGEKGKGKGKKC